MGEISQLISTQKAIELEGILLAALTNGDQRTIDFCGTYVYPKYRRAINGTKDGYIEHPRIKKTYDEKNTTNN